MKIWEQPQNIFLAITLTNNQYNLFQIGYRWLDKQLTLAQLLLPHPAYNLGQFYMKLTGYEL